MLVLSRQRDESIAVVLQLGPHTFLVIEFVVVDVRGDKVRLGVVAPKQVLVHRWENWEAARAELEREFGAQDEKKGGGAKLVEFHEGDLPAEVIRHLGIEARRLSEGVRKHKPRTARTSCEEFRQG